MQCNHVACIWSVLMRSIMHLKLHFKGRSCSFALVLFADDLMHAYRVFDQLYYANSHFQNTTKDINAAMPSFTNA